MEEWGFRGFVVSDYFATIFTNNAGSCMDSGLSLEMPGCGFIDKGIKYKLSRLLFEYKCGMFTQKVLNENVKRLLRVMFLVGLFDDEKNIPKGSLNTIEHQQIAQKIAEEGIVLLKNDNDFL